MIIFSYLYFDVDDSLIPNVVCVAGGYVPFQYDSNRAIGEREKEDRERECHHKYDQ